VSVGTVTIQATGVGATITDDVATNLSYYPLFATVSTGNLSSVLTSSTKLTYNPSTGQLTAVDFNSTSDIIYKENVQSIANSLDLVNNINAVSFNWKDTGRKSYGVIAQELQQILPELVTQGSAGLAVSYLPLIAILLQAVKDQQTQIDELRNNLK
jgi:hypothetical protein